MATCRDVISRAFAMAGIVPLGDSIDATEVDSGMTVLQSIYDRIADARDYTPVYETGVYTAKEGERITGATSVTLPSLIDDDRKPIDMTFVQYDIGSGFVTYASDRGAWIALDDLNDGDDAPFSSRNSEGLSALVALELSETYPGATVGPMTARKARRFQTIFTREDAQEVEYF